ncbi:hypothetical protein UREG_02276 [Uncinocarpus reesii 1704]|uniref:Methyltransferase-like protein n=1 Tax=Uncinocarpus reesii (strain UAMH 1704) TaxID=336963 RepID=C4JF54_UNCRE|nr:uncharacterized protein UREG_02276 [Uncinocarpus reesii 1704]EEP77427.1 hypothetical protein UREG_02276 [Uncinocarpus reesii 1704]
MTDGQPRSHVELWNIIFPNHLLLPAVHAFALGVEALLKVCVHPAHHYRRRYSIQMSPLPLQGFDDYATIAQLVQPPQIPPHRSHDPSNNQKRTDPFQFGSRYLEEGDNVFEFNAWDHVETDEDYKQYTELQIAKQREEPVSDFDRQRFNSDPAKWWNLFYKNNTSNFFKNRKWLQQEFPVLVDVTKADSGPKVVLEVGAGAGNTAFPILANNSNPDLKIHACDYSKKAVEVIRSNEKYDEQYIKGRCMGRYSRSQGPKFFSRDYGRGDLAQVRFKKGRYLAENFYVRGDGTRVYFFEKAELAHIWGKWCPQAGLPEYQELPLEDPEASSVGEGAAFEIVDLAVDRRLIVNRKRKLKMYRCWMQGRFRKRESPPNGARVMLTAAEKGEPGN